MSVTEKLSSFLIRATGSTVGMCQHTEIQLLQDIFENRTLHSGLSVCALCVGRTRISMCLLFPPQWKNEEERKLKRKRRQERKAILKKNFKQSKYRKQAALLDDDEYLQILALHKAEEANKAKIKKGKHQKQKKGVGKAKAKK